MNKKSKELQLLLNDIGDSYELIERHRKEGNVDLYLELHEKLNNKVMKLLQFLGIEDFQTLNKVFITILGTTLSMSNLNLAVEEDFSEMEHLESEIKRIQEILHSFRKGIKLSRKTFNKVNKKRGNGKK